MSVQSVIQRVFHPSRFLADPDRYERRAARDGDSFRISVVDRSGLLSLEVMARRDASGWRAEAVIGPGGALVTGALDDFRKRHGVSFPLRFERAWPGSADTGPLEASLVDMIRKAVENMHMIHTLAPAALPAFPAEYLESEPADVVEPAADPLSLWTTRLERFLPAGASTLSSDDRRRFLRLLMTDEGLLPFREAIMARLAEALRRAEWPESDWTRDASGKPAGPPSPGLALVRLTNIRWMNDTAEVHEKLARAGRESSFAVFVKLLAALPGTGADAATTSAPSDEAAYAGALLVDWLFVHMNFYPVRGLGHRNDRIDFITNRLVFEEILLPWLLARGPNDAIRGLAKERSGRSRRILAALRNGFLQERLARSDNRKGGSPLSRWFGRSKGDLAPERSPLVLHPEIAAGLLVPLVERPHSVLEVFHYGLARSIADGREYWSASLLSRNLEELERQFRDAAPEAAAKVPWKEIARLGVLAHGLDAPPASWDALSARDQAYITREELGAPGFRALPPDWRQVLLRGET